MIGVMMCFDSTKTDVDIVLTLFPLSFRLSIIVFTSMGQIGEIVKFLLMRFCKYDAALRCDGAILAVKLRGILE